MKIGYKFIGVGILALGSTLLAAELEGEKFEPNEQLEKVIIEALAKNAAAKVEKLHLETKEKAIRDAHAKHHGCVHATFKVNDELAPELRQGIIAYEGKTGPEYKAWVRFSNGLSKVQPDWMPDGRGMAIKVIGVKGERIALEHTDEKATQDFPMINFPQFFVKNVPDYANFLKDQEGFMKTHEEERKIATAIASQFITSPLEAQYFSMTPARLGKPAMKFSAKPCRDTKTFKFGELDLMPLATILKSVTKPEELATKAAELAPYDIYLRQGLAYQLANASEDFCFDFMVQLQTEGDPIEDPRQKWKGEFQKVARVSIPQQTISSRPNDPELPQDAFCENLSLNPWHSLVAHQPLGGIQRARRPVYEAVAEVRHRLNLVEPKEPNGDERF